MILGEVVPLVVYACGHYGVPLTDSRAVTTVVRRVLKAAGVPETYTQDLVSLVTQVEATTVARAADHVICPTCGVEEDMSNADSGNYDVQEENFDCPACGKRIHVETVLLLVAATTAEAAARRATLIRGDATTSAPVRALMAARSVTT